MLVERKSMIVSGGSRAEVGERVALAKQVFDRFGTEIRAIIRFNVKDKSIADDIFQDFFLSTVSKPIPPSIQGAKDTMAYLYKAITNNIIDISRRTNSRRDREWRYARRNAEFRSYFVVEEDAQDVVIQAEEVENMFRLIKNHLPKREAKAVIHKYGHDLNTVEIAERMHINPGSVHQYLSVALKKIRQLVRENGDEIR